MALAAKPEPPATPEKPATVKPLSPARYKVAFTASEELRDKLERLQALMPGGDLASIIDAAVSEKLERLQAKRYGKANKPRNNLEDADTSPGVRGISAPVKRAVWERDGGRCTFVGAEGKRCPERHRLEFHHEEPYALGGDRSADNLRLLCPAHNAYMAELDYGKEKMHQHRRSSDRVCEPQPRLEFAGTKLPKTPPSHDSPEPGARSPAEFRYGWRTSRRWRESATVPSPHIASRVWTSSADGSTRRNGCGRNKTLYSPRMSSKRRSHSPL